MLSMHRDATSANNWCDGERIQQGTIAGCEGTRWRSYQTRTGANFLCYQLRYFTV